MRKILGLFVLLLAITEIAQAQVTPPAAQITAATTNATCVGGTPNGGAVDLTIGPQTGTVGVSITGTWSATLNIQLSTNHGTLWTASGSTFTANQQSVIGVSGYSDVCVFASAYTSGTAQVIFTQSTAPLGAGGGTTTVAGGSANGTAASGNPVPVGGIDNSGNIRYIECVNISGIGCALVNTNGATVSDGLTTSGGLLSTNGSNVPLNIFSFLFNGATWDRAIVCENTSTFSVSSTTTQVIAASGSTKVRICSFDINPSTATAGTVDLVYGTGTNCATGTTTLTGAYTLPAAAVVDITPSTLSATSPLTTPASQAVCVRAVTSTVNGFIVWEQH